MLAPAEDWGLEQWIETLDIIHGRSLSELRDALFLENVKVLTRAQEPDEAERLVRNIYQLVGMAGTVIVSGLAIDLFQNTYEYVRASLEYIAKKGYTVSPDLRRVRSLYDDVEDYRHPMNNVEGGLGILVSTPERIRTGEFLMWYARGRMFAPSRQEILNILVETGHMDPQLPGVGQNRIAVPLSSNTSLLTYQP